MALLPRLRLDPAALAGVEAQLQLIHERFRESVAGLDNQQRLLNDKFGELIGAVSQIALSMPPPATRGGDSLDLLLSACLQHSPRRHGKLQRCSIAYCVMWSEHTIMPCFGGTVCSRWISLPNFVTILRSRQRSKRQTARQEPTTTNSQTAFAGDTIR